MQIWPFLTSVDPRDQSDQVNQGIIWKPPLGSINPERIMRIGRSVQEIFPKRSKIVIWVHQVLLILLISVIRGQLGSFHYVLEGTSRMNELSNEPSPVKIRSGGDELWVADRKKNKKTDVLKFHSISLVKFFASLRIQLYIFLKELG